MAKINLLSTSNITNRNHANNLNKNNNIKHLNNNIQHLNNKTNNISKLQTNFDTSYNDLVLDISNICN